MQDGSLSAGAPRELLAAILSRQNTRADRRVVAPASERGGRALYSDPHASRLTKTADRELALATYLSRWHASTRHHISASQCETMPLAELVALADAEDAARWSTLTLGYTDPLGAEWLRHAIASRCESLHETDVLCFAGAQEALYATLHALLLPDDHAIVVVPNYPAVEALALTLCRVSGVALDAADGWSLDIDAIADAIRPNTRLVAISFPNNPTGKLLDHDRFAALVALCRRHGIWLLSDEVYRLTERDRQHRLPTAAEAYERGISLGAVSKAYGLPGLRIGWAACRDRPLAARMATTKQYLSTCSAGPSEVLACIAIKAAPSILARNRAIAEANLTLLRAFLDRHQALFDFVPPEGGVVSYVRYLGHEGVEAWVTRMAETASVLLLPSSTFHSRLLDLPAERFRIGFGRFGFADGLDALERHL